MRRPDEWDGDWDAPEAIQERIRRHRARVLGGFGPGATEEQTAPYMHARLTLGGVPSPVAREAAAEQAALAKGDPEDVRQVLILRRARIMRTVRALAARVGPGVVRVSLGPRGLLLVAVASGAAALGAEQALRHRRGRQRGKRR